METLKDELLNLAFQLAHFIHNDKELAKRIAIAALEKLETAALAQDKRLYYPGRRNKVSMSELHLLQRLVYAESENHERRREQNATPPSEEVLLIHFIKHLAKITARRNAMHVTLGVCRLLHQYTTPETTEIYNAVLQDPGRVPSEDYFRSRKKTLMEEMKKRFGSLVNTTRGTRGEERFVAHAQPERFIELTRECLNAFTPWLTACCVPEKFALAEGSLSNLAFHGGDPDAEHSIEINRFHAILHPVCFARLVVGLGYAHPATRLEIPRFFLSSPNNSADDDEQNPNPPNRTSAKLNDEERNAIRRYLNDQARRRKYLSAGLLMFVADGELLAQLDPAQSANISFALTEHAEFIEVRTRDEQGELLLATHAVLYDDEDQPLAQRAAITLEGGQRLTFEINPAPTSATVTVNFTETSPTRALQQWLQQHNAPSVLLGALWQPALGLALLLALTGGLAWLLLHRPTVTPTDIVKTASPTPFPSPSATTSPTPAASPTAAISATPQPRPTTELYWPNDDVLVADLPSTNPAEELTRSEREAGASLREAKQVFLKITGGTPELRNLVNTQLRTQLPQEVPYTLTSDQNAADIALKLHVEPAKPSRTSPRIELTANIINADLKVIWPLTPGFTARKYSGPTTETINQFVNELAADIRRR